MKKALFLSAALTAVMASAALGQSIVGSAHDFSDSTWVTDQQICQPCHAPHNNLNTATNLLWNHKPSTTVSFTVYTNSATLNATTGQPDGSSKICLSCHDGSVALDAYGSRAGTVTISGAANVGSDLSNDHPVSFTYNTGLATTDGDLADPSSANSGLGSTIATDLLESGKMQCSSCHDVHNKYGINKLLVKANTNSGLCLTCHTK